MAATGVATSAPYNCAPGTEDTITLMVRAWWPLQVINGDCMLTRVAYSWVLMACRQVQWQNVASGNRAVGLYTSSWSASAKVVFQRVGTIWLWTCY